MEVFGGVASGLAIVGAASAAAKLAATTYSDIRDAPSNLNSLKLSLWLAQCVLEKVASMQTGTSLPVSVLGTFHEGLDAIRGAIAEIQHEYKKHLDRSIGKRVIVKWALVNNHVVEKQERRLQMAISFFNTLISLMQM